jgi:hypothetical protein
MMTDLERWHEFTASLAELGTRITAADFPHTRRDRAEGFRHLALQTACWLWWSVGHDDPRQPMFQRQNDRVLQWGGPNADNVYRHSRVDPSLTYRIRGRMHSCDDFILAIRRDFMHMEVHGTIAQLTAHDIGVGPGDDFEILLGGEGNEPNRVPLPEGALSVSIREYYFEWLPAEPATFTIECLDADAPPPPVDTERVAAALDEATAHLWRSHEYWNRYMLDARAEQTDNEFGGRYDVKQGLAAARYSFCFWTLAPDEALVVECDVPDSRYWSFHQYGLAWWEAFEYGSRVTTLNHTQTHRSNDGRVRVVVAHHDPGAPNWLDTEGRPEALLTLRWFWPRSEVAPQPTTRVVKLADVRDALPSDTPVVDIAARAAQIRARKDHLAWRFRS